MEEKELEEIKKLKDEVKKLRSLIDNPPIFEKGDRILVVDYFRNGCPLSDCIGTIKYSYSEGDNWMYEIGMDNVDMDYHAREQLAENLLPFERLRKSICEEK